MSRASRIAGLLLAFWAVAAVAAAPAQADFSVAEFDGAVSDASGNAFTQAGGHPHEAWTAFETRRITMPDGTFRSDGGNFRDVRVDLPPGLVGNPTAVPQCPRTRRVAVTGDFQGDPPTDPRELCPPDSAVGLAFVKIAGDPGMVETTPSVVFNLEPPPGVAASFGFNLHRTEANLDAVLRADGDYAISVRAKNAGQTAPVLGVKITLWGVPGDPSHDEQRCIAVTAIPIEFLPPACRGAPGTPLGPHSFTGEPKAFVTNPTACTPPGVGLETRIHVDAWNPASGSADGSFVSHLPPHYPAPRSAWGPPQGPTGCDLLPFDPSFGAQPDSSAADSPTGLKVDLGFPQDGLTDPEGLAPAQLRNARVTLPEGMTFNPAAAGGLVACSDAQVEFGVVSPVQCPQASKIATVRASTPLLEEELTGAVYVGSQLSDDPESGDMFRIVLALENPERGIFVKLLGKVRASATTGRLATTFQNNPQLPISTLSVRFKDGPRAPLATPPTCGQKTVDAELTSWAGHVVNLSDSFTVACTGDLGGFAPAFNAGTTTPKGGAFSPFSVRIDRADREQYLSGVTLEMPPGLIARLKDVPLCGEAHAAAGTCPIETRVGTATVGAGTGSDPFFLTGSVSLTGAYKGAPYGLSVAVRAIAGPFDLGTVVVRQAIFVDPVDAHLTVVSDPLPTIIKGVPLRLRSVNVDVDRPGFVINPTSCAAHRIKATLVSDRGAIHQASQRFQAGDCRALPLKPRLRLRLTGRGRTNDGEHPGLRAVLTQRAGQANLRKVAVKLPLALALDPENAQSESLCDFEAGRRVDCPRSSIIGRARAVTPVLNRPLTGPVYFVKNVRFDRRTGRPIRTLPTLLIPLRGEVAIDLRASTSVKRGKLVNTFASVPDAPISRFELTLKGGKKGILVVTRNRNICKGQQIADVDIDGQNGRRADQAVRMKTPCEEGTS